MSIYSLTKEVFWILEKLSVISLHLLNTSEDAVLPIAARVATRINKMFALFLYLNKAMGPKLLKNKKQKKNCLLYFIFNCCLCSATFRP